MSTSLKRKSSSLALWIQISDPMWDATTCPGKTAKIPTNTRLKSRCSIQRHLVNPLRQLEFNDEATGKRVVRLSREHLRMRYEEPDDLNDQYDRIAREYLDRRGYKKVCKKTDDPAKECQIDKPFQTATLEIMRASTDADVVLVQKRDFYYGPFNMRTKPDSKDTNSLAKSDGEGFARILWKRDIV